MLLNINQIKKESEGLSEEVERFVVFRFPHRLRHGVKSRIKSLGCSWNVLHHGWICPLARKEEAQKAIEEAALQCEIQSVLMPAGVIPVDPKIAARQTRLELLEEQLYKDNMLLLKEVYCYDNSLRPEDFAKPLPEEGKNTEQLRIEKDFHDRWIVLQKTREAVEQARNEVSHLNADSTEKIFDSEAPLLIADALIQKHFLHNEIRTLQYCSEAFWQWDGIKYIEMSKDEMRQTIYSFLRDARELNSAGYLESFNPNKFKVDQIVDALHAICHQKHHPANGAVWLDQREQPNPQYLISFRNGLLNVEDWLKNPMALLISHTPLLLNVNSLTFDFDPQAPEPQEWMQFLNGIWPDDLESQQALQEWAGYLLVHDTRLHKILLIIGPPRSGKGTIGRIFRELLGPFNVAGPTLSSLSGEFGLQPFLNKMLALISDARLNGRGNNSIIIERLLSISGEDPLTINRKFLPPLTVQLPTRIMMMSNELPDMRDASGALSKRYLVLTLLKSWFGNEDTSLFSRLSTELPGILLWALQGLARLNTRGRFTQPASSIQTIEELEAITSPIKTFIAERCDINPLAKVPIAVLYDAWSEWCNISGYPHAGNVQSFGKNLRAAFPEIELIRPQEGQIRERCYKGITINSIPHPSADVRGQKWEGID